MSQSKANKSSSSKTAAASPKDAASSTIESAAATGSGAASGTSKRRSGTGLFNRYVVVLGSIMLILLASRISITPGYSSEDKDETISVAGSDVAAVYRDDSFGARVPVDYIVETLWHVSHFFDRTLDPEISLVSWVFNREAGKLSKSLTEIAFNLKQDWTESMVKSDMTEKAVGVLDALIATIDIDSMGNNQHNVHSHNPNMSPMALARELRLLIQIISETLTGNQAAGLQSPSLRTANYIDYMKIKINKVSLPDIIKEYGVLFKRMGLERILIGLKEVLVEWKKEFKPES